MSLFGVCDWIVFDVAVTQTLNFLGIIKLFHHKSWFLSHMVQLSYVCVCVCVCVCVFLCRWSQSGEGEAGGETEICQKGESQEWWGVVYQVGDTRTYTCILTFSVSLIMDAPNMRILLWSSQYVESGTISGSSCYRNTEEWLHLVSFFILVVLNWHW